MDTSSIEPRLSSYLHAKACRAGTPLSGNFELTARCNFNCRMCYVHLTPEEQRSRGRELTADEWLAIAETARSRGMLFLLLTGGEPLIRPDFRYILTELKKMGLMVSVNSNGSLIDSDWLDFFRSEPPFLFNITLHGAGNESYEALCGRPAFTKVTENIRALKEIGVGVKLNVSMTPWNVRDMAEIHKIAEELGTPMQLATYMFPPVRRSAEMVGKNDRFTPEEAAGYEVMWDKLRFTPEVLCQRAEAMAKGLELPREETCEGTPGEGISCRAGRAAFWINWRGDMTPCGMMTEPSVPLTAGGFAESWKKIRALREEIMVPAKCSACPMANACDQCAAVCFAESGSYTAAPEYMCEQTKCLLEQIRADEIWKNTENRGKN